MPEKFVKVAAIDDIEPGKMRRFEVGGGHILLANVGGQIFAADDMCTHEDASLSTGSLRGRYVKCPLHGSRFDLQTGEPMEEPASDPLRIYAVRLEGRDIFVDFGGHD
jgi:3-phenylpropionate/trans-cinnamate dioxygenase ferredoxin subunit